MIRLRSAASVVGLLVLLAVEPASAQNDRSLYERMGGYDVIAAFVDDFFARFGADPELAPYLGGINAAEGARVRQHLVDFVCARTGGPCLYTGRTMAEAHEGLGITEAHFDTAVAHMGDALDAQGVGGRERTELLTMVRGLKGAIVAPTGEAAPSAATAPSIPRTP